MRRLLPAIVATLLLTVATGRAAEVNALLPKETEQVVYFNFKQAMESDIIKKYAKTQFKQMLDGEQVKQYTEAFGIDPMKDLDSLTVGLWGKDEPIGMAVLKGKFDTKKLFEAAKAEAAKSKDKVEIVDIKGDDGEFKAIKLSGENSDKAMYLSVADGTTVVASSEEKMLAKTLSSFNKKEKSKLEKRISDLVIKQDDKATMWYCAVVEGKLNDVNNLDQLGATGIDPEAFKKQLKNLQTIGMTLRLAEAVSLEINMGMKDADSADEMSTSLEKLVDTAKSFLPFLSAQAPKAKGIVSDLTKTLKTTSKNSDVTLGFKITAEAIKTATASGDDD